MNDTIHRNGVVSSVPINSKVPLKQFSETLSSKLNNGHKTSLILLYTLFTCLKLPPIKREFLLRMFRNARAVYLTKKLRNSCPIKYIASKYLGMEFETPTAERRATLPPLRHFPKLNQTGKT